MENLAAFLFCLFPTIIYSYECHLFGHMDYLLCASLTDYGYIEVASTYGNNRVTLDARNGQVTCINENPFYEIYLEGNPISCGSCILPERVYSDCDGQEIPVGDSTSARTHTSKKSTISQPTRHLSTSARTQRTTSQPTSHFKHSSTSARTQHTTSQPTSHFQHSTTISIIRASSNTHAHTTIPAHSTGQVNHSTASMDIGQSTDQPISPISTDQATPVTDRNMIAPAQLPSYQPCPTIWEGYAIYAAFGLGIFFGISLLCCYACIMTRIRGNTNYFINFKYNYIL